MSVPEILAQLPTNLPATHPIYDVVFNRLSSFSFILHELDIGRTPFIVLQTINQIYYSVYSLQELYDLDDFDHAFIGVSREIIPEFVNKRTFKVDIIKSTLIKIIES